MIRFLPAVTDDALDFLKIKREQNNVFFLQDHQIKEARPSMEL